MFMYYYSCSWYIYVQTLATVNTVYVSPNHPDPNYIVILNNYDATCVYTYSLFTGGVFIYEYYCAHVVRAKGNADCPHPRFANATIVPYRTMHITGDRWAAVLELGLIVKMSARRHGTFCE